MAKAEQGDDFGERVAQLLRAGSRAQYDELQNFLAGALRSDEQVCGEVIMEVIWALLPTDAQKKIAEGGEVATRNAGPKG